MTDQQVDAYNARLDALRGLDLERDVKVKSVYLQEQGAKVAEIARYEVQEIAIKPCPSESAVFWQSQKS
jgi:hypothetical protein